MPSKPHISISLVPTVNLNEPSPSFQRPITIAHIYFNIFLEPESDGMYSFDGNVTSEVSKDMPDVDSKGLAEIEKRTRRFLQDSMPTYPMEPKALLKVAVKTTKASLETLTWYDRVDGEVKDSAMLKIEITADMTKQDDDKDSAKTPFVKDSVSVSRRK